MEACRSRNRSKSLGTKEDYGPVEVTPVPVSPVGNRHIIQKKIRLPSGFSPRQLTGKRTRKIAEFAKKFSLEGYGTRPWIVALIAHLGESLRSVRINDVRCWLKMAKFQKFFGMEDMIYSPSASNYYGVEIVGIQVVRSVQERGVSPSINNVVTPVSSTRKSLELKGLLENATFIGTYGTDLNLRVTRARLKNEQEKIGARARVRGTQRRRLRLED